MSQNNTVKKYYIYLTQCLITEYNILLVIFVFVGNQKAQIGEWWRSDWCPLSPGSVLRQSPHAGPDSPVLLWGPFLWGGGWLFFQGGVKTNVKDIARRLYTQTRALCWPMIIWADRPLSVLCGSTSVNVLTGPECWKELLLHPASWW